MNGLTYNLQTYMVPFLGILIPLLIFVSRFRKNDMELALNRKKITQFFLVWSILSFIVFTGLIYLTGGINAFFRLEKGLNITNRDLTWNATKHWQIIFIYNPGFSLLAIAILSGLMYATLLVLPKVCTLLPTGEKTELANVQTTGTTASVGSSLTAGASAITTTAVCCGTSAISVIAPTIGVIFAPYAAWLLIGSLALMIYSFNSVVMPRFPIIKRSNLPLNIS